MGRAVRLLEILPLGDLVTDVIALDDFDAALERARDSASVKVLLGAGVGFRRQQRVGRA
jgi:hypothetical protein